MKAGLKVSRGRDLRGVSPRKSEGRKQGGGPIEEGGGEQSRDKETIDMWGYARSMRVKGFHAEGSSSTG